MSCSAFAPIPGTQAPGAGRGELTLASSIACDRLHAAIVPVACCLLRQDAAARGRTLQASRGQGTLFPSCDGCPQGAAVRARVVGGGEIRWEGSGPGHRFDRGRDGMAAQHAARRRLLLVGALDIPPSLDEPPEPDEAEEPAL